jgi:hypothetical protein
MIHPSLMGGETFSLLLSGRPPSGLRSRQPPLTYRELFGFPPRSPRQLIEMARADESGPSGARRTGSGTLRYDGSGRLIRPAEVVTLSAAFQRKFAKPMPISAWGETATHAMLGFDHHGRVDVAVGPDSPEGRWIRAWLERSHIPYYGFRTALLGRSTGPHIHIGPGSLRMRAADRRLSARAPLY